MNKINVIVPDMQSNHCTSRVSLILNKIDGIQTEEIKSGEVTFSFEDDYAKEELKKLSFGIIMPLSFIFCFNFVTLLL